MGVSTVTQEGMVPSQPGMCVSYSGYGPTTLSVFRAYRDLPNQWGGKGVHKHCDAHGRVFPTCEEAEKFCIERGYVRPYHSSLRAKRKAEARDPRLSRNPSNLPTWQQLCEA